jgi:putative phosphoribosyl transferase
MRTRAGWTKNAGAVTPNVNKDAMIFEDRRDAGRKLAAKLSEYEGRENVLILALPRGGVPVAFEAARRLSQPLDIFLVRKLGVPGREELAMGAIASGGVRVLNKEEVIDPLRIPDAVIDAVAEKERKELERRAEAYRNGRPEPVIEGKTIILIDDGLATGATMRAAAYAIKQQKPAKVVIAVPVSSPETCEEFEREVSEIVCAATPEPFYGVGKWYRDFSQTTDAEVRELLEKSRSE